MNVASRLATQALANRTRSQYDPILSLGCRKNDLTRGAGVINITRWRYEETTDEDLAQTRN